MARAGGDHRGSSYSRRKRKLWMLETFGDGQNCPCAHCKKPLDFKTVEADRIEPGASYRRSNIQPSCSPCNKQRGTNVHWVHPTKGAIT